MKAARENILVVDDETAIRDLITDVLTIAGYQIKSAKDGLEALNLIRKEKFALILLDVNLPKIDGFTILEKLQEISPGNPVIMLSARTDKEDVTKGLKLGADDYIRKPFGVEELVLRIEKLLNRNSKEASLVLQCGPITLDSGKHLVTLNGENIELSPTEFSLLYILMQNMNLVLTKEKLLDLVWGVDFVTSSNVVDTYISYLRKKLHTKKFTGIKTVRGIGFKLENS